MYRCSVKYVFYVSCYNMASVYSFRVNYIDFFGIIFMLILLNKY